ncbi:MAG: rRNA (cytidine-2'-O-)-methyltransferase, partial [Brevundimonas sp.]
MTDSPPDLSPFPPTAPPPRAVAPGLYLVATPIGN